MPIAGFAGTANVQSTHQGDKSTICDGVSAQYVSVRRQYLLKSRHQTVVQSCPFKHGQIKRALIPPEAAVEIASVRKAVEGGGFNRSMCGYVINSCGASGKVRPVAAGRRRARKWQLVRVKSQVVSSREALLNFSCLANHLAI